MCNYAKLKCGFCLIVTSLNGSDRLASSVDPEQSDPGLHCLPRSVCSKT